MIDYIYISALIFVTLLWVNAEFWLRRTRQDLKRSMALTDEALKRSDEAIAMTKLLIARSK